MSENSIANKFTYFWGWTLISQVPILYRSFALDVYSTFWQFLLAYQFFLFFKKLDFSRAWAKVQVLATILFFGTNLLSFYRYYALSSTILAYIAYLQSVMIVMDILTSEQAASPRKRSYSFYLLNTLWLLILVIVIYYSHFQELIFLGISLLALLFYHFYTKPETQKITLGMVSLVTVISLLFGFFIVRYPELVPTRQWNPESPYISNIGTFRLWDTKLSYFETIGVHGVISLLMALAFIKKHKKIALLTLFPYYMLLFPPFVLLFSISHDQPSDWITYRALFAFPTSIMIVQGLKEIADNLKNKLPFGLNEIQKIIVVTSLVTLLSLSPAFPYRGKLWFQLYIPPASLELKDIEVAAHWLTRQPDDKIKCLLMGDNATAFVMATHFTFPPSARTLAYNISHTVRNYEQLEQLVRLKGKCGLLVAVPTKAKDIPDSRVAQLSGHWRPSIVRDDFLLSSNFENLARSLINEGWSRTFVPPFYQLFRPAASQELDADVSYIMTVEDVTAFKGGELKVIAADRPMGPITASQPVLQTFLATRNHLSGISLLLTTYNRQNSGPVYFHLQHAEQIGTPHYLGTISVDAAEVIDGNWLTITFPPLDSSSQRYAIVIESPSADPNNAITTWMHTGNSYSDGQLFQAGQVIDGDLVFGLLYESK